MTHPGRPLVTFALFAYNQEKYIREAVEGAFAQTYQPLEIILSDDCSSDRTFEIMQEMAAGYTGPHDVRVRRSVANNGVLSHINGAVSIARGQIVIMAAGDDISFPFRTTVTVNAFLARPETMAIFTKSSELPPRLDYCFADLKFISPLRIALGGGGVGMGAAYSYKRDCFNCPELLPENLYSEDRILPMRAAILGLVGFVDVSTISHRDTPDSITKKLGNQRLFSYENVQHLDFLSMDVRALYSGSMTWKGRLILLLIRLRIVMAKNSNNVTIKWVLDKLILRVTSKLIHILHFEKSIPVKVKAL